MSEAAITKKTKTLLDAYEASGEPLYFNKISDRFTSGIPDIQGTFHGVSFYIELKDEGEEARKLQLWHLKKARSSGAEVLSTDSFDEVAEFMERIRLNHEHIVKERYN
ncbi:MAG: hypothetical protein KAI25_02095 [Hyphomicrobiaceae bacterium]|nr:hypothetical protein [Hyphomicrobiaceae bacterium]